MDQAARQIERLTQAAARVYRLHLRILGEDDVVLAEAHLTAPPGIAAVLDAGVERAYVSDWDVEVAQEARVGDPIVSTAYGGLLATLRADPLPVGGQVAVRIGLNVAHLPGAFEVRRPRNEMTGIVEIPVQHRVRVARDLLLTPGEAMRFPGGRLGETKLVVEISVGE